MQRRLHVRLMATDIPTVALPLFFPLECLEHTRAQQDEASQPLRYSTNLSSVFNAGRRRPWIIARLVEPGYIENVETMSFP